MSNDTIAARCAQAMYKNDDASRMLGIEVAVEDAGRATARMRVRQDMLNGFDVCHGGLIFSLADTAFAFACNGYGSLTYAAQADIDFLRPAHLNQRLTAEAIEGNRSRRLGMYDVIVTNDEGEKVCHFRGRTYGVRGSVTAGPEQ